MPPPLNTNKSYEHLQRVEWPKDLPGPNYWIPDYTLLSGLPKAVKARVHNVTTSGTRFYQKAKRLPAPMISGDKSDPDAIHALKVALIRQDELENAIKPPNEHQTDSLMLWLQERKRSLVKSMLAVVIAEEGEMYDEVNRDPWEVKLVRMTDEHVEFLRFIFRTVMARIDIVPAENPNDGKIKPVYKEVVVQPRGGINVGIYFPPAPSVSFWEIDDSLMENATPKMRQAPSALYHQGRVLTAARNNIPVIEQKPFSPVSMSPYEQCTSRSAVLTWCELRDKRVWSKKKSKGFSLGFWKGKTPLSTSGLRSYNFTSH